MILKFGARCRSRAEALGILHAVAVEPGERLVLGLVIEEMQAEPLVRVRVPFGRVESADADQVSLALSLADYRALPRQGPEPARGTRRPPRSGKPTGPDERLLTARTKIECRDGDVGALTHLIVDPRTGDLLGLAFPFGLHLMRDLRVDIGQVEEMTADRIAVRFDKNEIEHLPSLRA